MELADRVVVMSQGRIERSARPDEVTISRARRSCLPSSGIKRASGHGLPWPGLASTIGRSPFRPTVRRTVLRGCSCGRRIAVVRRVRRRHCGVVTATHRHGGLRRFDLVSAGRSHHRVEIALPAADSRDVSGRIAFLPRRWRIYPAGERYSKT